MRMIKVKCSECKKEFERSTLSRTTVCSPECDAERDRRLKRESRRRAAGEPTGFCMHCGARVESRRKYCARAACQLERKRQNNMASNLRYAELMRSDKKRQCSECGRWFGGRSEMFVTCGRPKCVKSRARKVKNDRYRKNAEAMKVRKMAEQSYSTTPVYKIDQMPCPWASGQLTTAPAPGYGWHTAEADPMSAGWDAGGVWFTVRKSETRKERRAA